MCICVCTCAFMIVKCAQSSKVEIRFHGAGIAVG